MSMKHLVLVATLFTLCASMDLYSQEGEFVPKDNPAVPSTSNDNSMEFLGNEMMGFFDEAEVIEAFHFKMTDRPKTEKDSSGFFGFKVAKHIPRLYQREARKLVQAVSAAESYHSSDFLPKCGFDPDLAFRFNQGEESLSVLFMTFEDCNVAKFYKGDQLVVTKDFCPSRNAFVELGKALFPREYFDVALDSVPCMDPGSSITIVVDQDTIRDQVEGQMRGIEGNTHIYQVGESLEEILAKSGLSKEELIALNSKKLISKLEKGRLKGGEKITIKNDQLAEIENNQ